MYLLGVGDDSGCDGMFAARLRRAQHGEHLSQRTHTALHEHCDARHLRHSVRDGASFVEHYAVHLQHK